MSDQIPIEMSELPGSEATRRFEGDGHGSSVSFFYVNGPPGSGPSLHRHPYEETFIVESGEALFVVGDREIEATGGQIVIAPPNTPHKFTNTGTGTLHLVGIHSAPRIEQEDLE